MSELDIPCKAEDPKDLEQRIMSANVAKGAAEWWAKRTIEDLQSQLEAERMEKQQVQVLAIEFRNFIQDVFDCAVGVDADGEALSSRAKELLELNLNSLPPIYTEEQVRPLVELLEVISEMHDNVSSHDMSRNYKDIIADAKNTIQALQRKEMG